MPIILRWLLRQGPANPIAVRLVQNASRRTKHMYLRAAYLATLIVVLLWVLLISTSAGTLDYQSLAKAGAGTFTTIAYLQIVLICILAPVFMGGAIAQESSPRTWDILLTTPLTASEIVLGNLLGRLFFIIGLLFCSLPLFALTQYFGGVPGPSIIASYIIAACAALLVGALAIALAVSRLVGKRAFFAFYIAIVTYLGVTLAIDFWLVNSNMGASGGKGVTYMTALNPFLTLKALLNPATYPRAEDNNLMGTIQRWMLVSPVTTFCVGSFLLSCFFLVTSTFTVRSGGLQSLGTDESGLSWYQRTFGVKTRSDGDDAPGRHRAPRHVGTNPISWREASSRNSQPSKIIARWGFVAMGVLLGLTLIYLYHTRRLSVDAFQFALLAVVWVEITVIALVAIMASATAISKEREDGTLDLLLTTPITASSYLTGKVRGLIAYLLPLLSVPLITLVLAGLYVIFNGFAGEAGVMTAPRTVGTVPTAFPIVLPEAGFIVTIATIPFIAFCVMVGLQWSLKSKGTLGSIVGTVLVVGAISGVIGLCGWNASSGLSAVGPILGALSPASVVASTIMPYDRMGDSLTQVGLTNTRISLAVGAVVAAAVYTAICYGIHSNMVRTFDMTVRKLAGNK
jgi:ABC-type transport system involved in multi-copper enzyme maturation permease subunit